MLGRKCSDLLPEVFVRQTGMLALHIRLGGCGGSTASASLAPQVCSISFSLSLFLFCFVFSFNALLLILLLTLFNSLRLGAHLEPPPPHPRVLFLALLLLMFRAGFLSELSAFLKDRRGKGRVALLLLALFSLFSRRFTAVRAENTCRYSA